MMGDDPGQFSLDGLGRRRPPTAVEAVLRGSTTSSTTSTTSTGNETFNDTNESEAWSVQPKAEMC